MADKVLKTTIIRNPTEETQFYAFVPPHGIRVPAGETRELTGDFISQMAKEKRPVEIKAFLDDLRVRNRVSLIQTPSPYSMEQIFALADNPLPMGIGDPTKGLSFRIGDTDNGVATEVDGVTMASWPDYTNVTNLIPFGPAADPASAACPVASFPGQGSLAANVETPLGLIGAELTALTAAGKDAMSGVCVVRRPSFAGGNVPNLFIAFGDAAPLFFVSLVETSGSPVFVVTIDAAEGGVGSTTLFNAPAKSMTAIDKTFVVSWVVNLVDDSVRIYLNGRLIGSHLGVQGASFSATGSLGLYGGGFLEGSKWGGLLGDLTIYGEALSDAGREAVEDFCQEKFGGSEFVDIVRLPEGSRTIWFDASLNPCQANGAVLTAGYQHGSSVQGLRNVENLGGLYLSQATAGRRPVFVATVGSALCGSTAGSEDYLENTNFTAPPASGDRGFGFIFSPSLGMQAATQDSPLIRWSSATDELGGVTITAKAGGLLELAIYQRSQGERRRHVATIQPLFADGLSYVVSAVWENAAERWTVYVNGQLVDLIESKDTTTISDSSPVFRIGSSENKIAFSFHAFLHYSRRLGPGECSDIYEYYAPRL